jgi:hypothetical protein
MTIEPVQRLLESAGVEFALIGAHALAAHGFPRFTVDIDLLTTDARVLDGAMWRPLAGSGATVDVRRGDADDPLAGVVHVLLPDGTDVDIVVGRWQWERDVVLRAEHRQIAPAISVPVVRLGDFVLLKLAAGGSIDLRDVELILQHCDREVIAREVEAHIGEVRPDVRQLWHRCLNL